MRTARNGFCTLLGALALFVGGGAAAQADDCHCDAYGRNSVYTSRGAVNVHCHPRGTTSFRDPYHPSTRYVVPRNHGAHRGCHGYGAHGSPWSVLRRYLRPSGSAAFRRAYVSRYFLRRYPFAEANSAERTRIDELLAQAEGADAPPLPAEALLQRGMTRFFLADYEGAATDFDAVLTLDPKEARARYGRLFCAVCRSDVRGAVGHLDLLAKAGEIRKDDRVATKEAFADPDVFPAVVAGLRGHARYSIADGNAHLVAGWALAMAGKPVEARAHVRSARRWGTSNAALDALEENLGLKKAPTAVPASAPPTPEAPVRAPKVVGTVIARVAATGG